MKLDKLRGVFARNRVALGALGVLAVGALAWRARNDGATASSSAAGDVAQPAGTSTAPSYYTGAGGTAYDSTSSDVYNAIQPQLEALQALYDRLPIPGTATEPAPAPTPAPTTAPAPSVQGYYRRAGSDKVYEARSDGTLDWIDSAEWDSAGQPKPVDLAPTDSLWNRKVVGADT